MTTQATDTKTRWTVSPYYTPRGDSDPLGVFRIKEIEAEAQKWDDALPDTEPGSEEEQSALDRREAVTESARRLIAAAPELLEALRDLAQVLEDQSGDLSDAAIAYVPELNAALSAIAKAEGGEQ